jgi:hypothetical protein
MARCFVLANDEVLNPAGITWSPVQLGVVMAVQMTSHFDVQIDGMVQPGEAGDYLVRNARGDMFPLPAWLFALLDTRLLRRVEIGEPPAENLAGGVQGESNT